MTTDIDRVADAVRAFGAGEIVVVTDDDDRENEGDLILAAVHATPEKIAFIIRHTSGIVCAPLTRDDRAPAPPRPDGRRQRRAARHRLHRLGRFPPRHHHRHLGRGALRHGPRARQPQCRRRRFRPARPCLPADRPRGRRAHALRPYRGGGRPLPAGRPAAGRRARRAGQRRRHGQARRRGRAPSPRQHGLRIVSVADLIACRQRSEKLVERVAEFPIETPAGPARAIAYRTRVGRRRSTSPSSSATSATAASVPVRLHREAVVDDVFCGDEPARPRDRRASARPAAASSSISARARSASPAPAAAPRDAIGGDERHASAADREREWREIGLGAQILRDLGVTSIRLLASRERRYVGLDGFGIAIDGTDIID